VSQPRKTTTWIFGELEGIFTVCFEVTPPTTFRSQDSSVSTQTKLRLDDRGSIPGEDNDRISSFRHRIQTDSGAQPASYPVDTGCSFIGGKATAAWSRQPTSI
jgi:hypothetical protein